MIDIWLIFTMMYPFFSVMLHSLTMVKVFSQISQDMHIYFFKINSKGEDKPKKAWCKRRLQWRSEMMLKWVLPGFGFVFAFGFWSLGLIYYFFYSAPSDCQ